VPRNYDRVGHVPHELIRKSLPSHQGATVLLHVSADTERKHCLHSSIFNPLRNNAFLKLDNKISVSNFYVLSLSLFVLPHLVPEPLFSKRGYTKPRNIQPIRGNANDV
jgi:hypothetical protein